MDLWHKVDLLGRAARWDTCQGCGSQMHRTADDIGRWIYPAVRPDGHRVKLLKVLQSNVCQNDCGYCAFRAGRDLPRASLAPEELARLFDGLYRSGKAEGLFLSSGVCGDANRTSERMLGTLELLRRHYHLNCYIHFKLLPGVQDAVIEQAMRWANRVSVNLEAPNASRLQALSSAKDYDGQLLGTLQRAHAARERLGARVSLTTQFVVGAANETDAELLQRAASLYGELGLARAYYSAFQPIHDTPLENHAATPLWREHRLYQADFLLHHYGFGNDELVYDARGNLPREDDPKSCWARQHPELFPIDVNIATRAQLLRIPGVGPISADRIIARRRLGELRQMRHLGLNTAGERAAASYILLNGRQPAHQLGLWNAPLLHTLPQSAWTLA
jgi:predicted DNA-binding helix-hairpin-helix protein